MIRADNSLNFKTRGVSISFKEHLVVRPISYINLNECLVLEINIQNKKGNIISLYLFKKLWTAYILQNELNLLFMLIIGDFNVWSSTWWKNDVTTSKGSPVDAITLSYGLNQHIHETTHILPNLSLCTDLNFIKVILSWIVAFTIVYPPLYEQLFWNYKNTNTQLLNSTIEAFNWEKLLENKNVNEHIRMLYLFNKTNILIMLFQIRN